MEIFWQGSVFVSGPGSTAQGPVQGSGLIRRSGLISNLSMMHVPEFCQQKTRQILMIDQKFRRIENTRV